MADSRGPTLMIGGKQLAMSKALGAAFLTHQVEQLEKSTTNNNGYRRDGGRNHHQNGNSYNSFNSNNRGSPRTGFTQRNVTQIQSPSQVQGQGGTATAGSPPKHRRVSGDRTASESQQQQQPRRRSNETATKDADIIVVDASVLVHCLNQFKAWCRDGRDEIIVVPLEALNTLDLLKKGTTPLAQRARAASRILEAQVGVNDRIQVQSDAAFVLWDSIPFTEASDTDKASDAGTSPEWVRRTICCARYETDKAEKDTVGVEANQTQTGTEATTTIKSSTPKKKVVFAVAQSTAQAPLIAKSLSDSASPVPLPAPLQTAVSKYEPRATGTLVRSWGARAGLNMAEIKPTPLPADEPERNHNSNHNNERSSGPSNNDRGGHGGHGNGNGGGNGGGSGRSPGRPRRTDHGHGPSSSGGRGPVYNGNGNGSLVERPPAVQTMMNLVNKPSGGIRLLARGEKLEP